MQRITEYLEQNKETLPVVDASLREVKDSNELDSIFESGFSIEEARFNYKFKGKGIEEEVLKTFPAFEEWKGQNFTATEAEVKLKQLIKIEDFQGLFPNWVKRENVEIFLRSLTLRFLNRFLVKKDISFKKQIKISLSSVYQK